VSADLVGLAFAAGLVAALNPCGFAMLPVYLAYVVAESGPGRTAAVARAVWATVVMTLGFVVVFAVFGSLTIALASTIQPYLPVVTVVVGAGLIGVAYAVASLSCTVGPFLAVTTAGVRSGSPTGAAAVYLAYAGGFALVVGTLAVGAAFTSSALADRLRGALPVIGRISGLLVLAVGLYVTYYGVYELRIFHTDAAVDDPVISAAGRLQTTIAGWVHGHGGWPWVVALAVLLLAAAAAWRRRHIRRRECRTPQSGG
jgi:cytochrome c biogenesis protein CcdA